MNKDNAHLYLPLVQALAEGKTIQHSYGDAQWADLLSPDFRLPASDYRIKPWSLSRHLPGFRPLRDCEEWHRQDWMEEMLPEGWRPLLANEKASEGDQVLMEGSGNEWSTYDKGQGELRDAGHVKEKAWMYRTKKPLPEPPKLIPLNASDWMKDGPWWITPTKNKFQKAMVIEVTDEEIFYLEGFMAHERATEYMRTNDGINWTPCSKPA
jgi:hypothetical protein